MARSRSPPKPFNTLVFRLSSEKPISFSVTSFHSMPSSRTPMLAPKIRDCLFVVSYFFLPNEGELFPPESGSAEEERKPKPNFRPGFGGGGGGLSSELAVPPVYVLCAADRAGAPAAKALCSYFCLMNRSIAESTSSTSIGTWGRELPGLYCWFELTFPTLRMFSTWSLDQLSMLSDLTFDTCVPSFRCRAAHRMHRKTPKLQLAQPGFRAWQSAHRSFPGTFLMSSCRAFSFRA